MRRQGYCGHYEIILCNQCWREHRMSVFNLADYDISAERGFLSSFDPDKTVLPHHLEPARVMAMSLPRLLVTVQQRMHLNALPFVVLSDVCAFASFAYRLIGILHYSLMVQTYLFFVDDLPI